jgi:hypothetical protein
MSEWTSPKTDAGYTEDSAQLLSQLRHGWAPLPTKTLFALAMGGLRVRMMRSVVTMLSIVFAIAFLTYTGLTNRLTINVAQAASNLETFAPVDPAMVASATTALIQANLLAGMSQDQQLALAANLGMGRIARQRAELPQVEQELRVAMTANQGATRELQKLQDLQQRRRTQEQAARLRVIHTENQVRTLTQQQEVLATQVALGTWVASRGAPPDPQLPVQLSHTLSERYATLVSMVRAPAQFTDEELEHVEIFLGLSEAAGHHEPVKVLNEALRQEHHKRDAASLRTMLRRAGVNIERTLSGNPMDTWLLTMAMLTCAVGIANAMLMSVTERFREIGTMKCLGAQDGLVVKLFLLESAFLGVVGALIGIVMGIAVAVGAGMLQFGFFSLKYFPRWEVVNVMLLSVLAGIVLAVAAAGYPAFTASRMKPVDALRVDE